MKPTRDPEGIEIEYLAATGALQGRRVVEIGCGDGRLTRRYMALARAVTAVDPDFERMREAIAAPVEEVSPPPVRFVQAEAQNLPLPHGVFDIALFSWSL